jgi:hypothetical protein
MLDETTMAFGHTYLVFKSPDSAPAVATELKINNKISVCIMSTNNLEMTIQSVMETLCIPGTSESIDIL